MPKNRDNVVVSATEEVAPRKKRNIIPLILSVLCAFVIWFYVVTVESPINEKTFEGVSVEVLLPSNGNLSIFQGNDTKINITVSGKKSQLNRMSNEDFRLTADASNYTDTGKHQIAIDFDLPEGVTLIEASTKELPVHLDVKDTTTLELEIELSNPVLNSGIELPGTNEIVKSVSEITVTGPKKALDNLEKAVATVEVGHVSGSMRAEPAIQLIKKDGTVETSSYITKSDESVWVEIPVFTTKKVKLKVDFEHGYLNDSNCKVTLEPSTLTVRGTVEALAEMEEYTIYEVDEKKITDDKVTIPLNLEGITTSEDIKSVEVRFEYIGISTKSITVSEFKVTNPEKLEYKIDTENINIELRGKTSQINKITDEDITLTVDLTGYKSGAGKVTLPVTVTVSDEYSDTVYELGTYTVDVTL